MIKRKECLKDMIDKIYGYQIVYYSFPDNENIVDIVFGGKSDLTATCTYTPKYKDRFATLFEYTFIPQKS